MGSGMYSGVTRTLRSEAKGYATKSASQIFTQRDISNGMDPSGVMLRESRDSTEHPNSVPIIIGLDVTASMGTVPHQLVKTGLPTMMETIINGGVPDPQVLFLGIGDHECDRRPLQVGQFESSDELLDKWLTDTYLEGGGGGNAGESYLLAWFFASRYTEIDSIGKGEKGFLFTIGDEPTLHTLPARNQEQIMGPGQYSDETSASLLAKASEKYHVYHINISETYSGGRASVVDGWKQILGDNLISVQSKDEVPHVIAKIVNGKAGTKTTANTVVVETTGDATGDVTDNSNDWIL
jgi:hypothetical protein